jgi:hypothetical protein
LDVRSVVLSDLLLRWCFGNGLELRLEWALGVLVGGAEDVDGWEEWVDFDLEELSKIVRR